MPRKKPEPSPAPQPVSPIAHTATKARPATKAKPAKKKAPAAKRMKLPKMVVGRHYHMSLKGSAPIIGELVQYDEKTKNGEIVPLVKGKLQTGVGLKCSEYQVREVSRTEAVDLSKQTAMAEDPHNLNVGV